MSKCTAQVSINEQGKVQTESCQAKQPLIHTGTCLDGCCDDYKCPDCNHTFRIEWPD